MMPQSGYCNSRKQMRPLLPVQSEPVFQRTWLPPSNQLYKVNVDGAVFKDRNESGVGVIIRDVNGLVVAAM